MKTVARVYTTANTTVSRHAVLKAVTAKTVTRTPITSTAAPMASIAMASITMADTAGAKRTMRVAPPRTPKEFKLHFETSSMIAAA